MIMLSQGVLGKSFGVANTHSTEYRTGWVSSLSEIIIPAFRLIDLSSWVNQTIVCVVVQGIFVVKAQRRKLTQLVDWSTSHPIDAVSETGSRVLPSLWVRINSFVYQRMKVDKFKYSHRFYWVFLNWGQHYVRFCSPNVAVADFFPIDCVVTR